jgi:PAS domain S-box-containing protein
MMVNDEPLVRTDMRELLENLAFGVIEAGNGCEALALFDAEQPDIVLTDLKMPQMGGLELIAALKEKAPETPVVVISGSGTLPDAIDAVRYGAWDYIAKPVEDGKGVEIVIRRALERARILAENREYQTRLEEMVRERTWELEESEARYRRILKSVTNYVYTVTFRDGLPESTLHHQGCEALTGFTPADYESDPNLWYSMVYEDDRSLVLERVRLIVDEPKPVIFECRILNKNGQLRWIKNTLVPHCCADGTLLSYEGIVNDITARKQSEEAQLVLERRFRELLENIQLVAVIIDTQGLVTFCNDYLLQLTGWNRDEVIGTDWFSRFIPGDMRERHQNRYSLGIATGDMPLHMEIRMLTRHGSERTLVCDNTVLHNADNTIAGVASIGIDVTEHRYLELQLHHSQKMEAVGQLAGGVAHDFNNILTVIIGYCALLRIKMKEDATECEHVDQIKAAAERASHLTRSLLTFSRKQPMIFRTVNLNSVVQNIEKFLARIIGEDIHMTTIFSEAALNVHVDCSQIEQILMNLATNARDAMPHGGQLVIETELVELDAVFVQAHDYGVAGTYARISVSDSGNGMDEETRSRIFEPFFTTKEVGKGTGLGLSIVYGIIKQHNGYIDVYSEPGKGTAFQIHLPVVERENAAAAEADGQDGLKTGNETILVVEDEAFVRRLVERVLVRFGYRVIIAVDGREAVEKYEEHRNAIRLVLMDMVMPEMNGKEAAGKIRQLSPTVKILFTSGYAADILQYRGGLEEETEIIAKPVHPLELLKKVREMLDRAEPTAINQ